MAKRGNFTTISLSKHLHEHVVNEVERVWGVDKFDNWDDFMELLIYNLKRMKPVGDKPRGRTVFVKAGPLER